MQYFLAQKVACRQISSFPLSTNEIIAIESIKNEEIVKKKIYILAHLTQKHFLLFYIKIF